MITKTAITDYLLPRQPMSLKDELKATIILIPLFLSNCVFKVVSFATLAAMLWYVTFSIYAVAIVLLHLPNILACCCGLKISYLTLGSPEHMVKLLVIWNEWKTTKKSMTNFLYNNICWLIFYTILLSAFFCGDMKEWKSFLTNFLWIGEKDRWGRGLPLEKVILGALVLKIVLICFQLWRPFKAEQQDRNEDIESGDEIVEEGSNTSLVPVALSYYLLLVFWLLSIFFICCI